MKKTNVMRLLDSKNIKYKEFESEIKDSKMSGEEMAELNGFSPEVFFKTLVTKANHENYVFVVPVNRELNLKKAAEVVNEKKIEMLEQKKLLPLTGYVHGGCSPIGMKKEFKTIIDISAKEYKSIVVNGGKVGYFIEIEPCTLAEFVDGEFADISDI